MSCFGLFICLLAVVMVCLIVKWSFIVLVALLLAWWTVDTHISSTKEDSNNV